MRIKKIAIKNLGPIKELNITPRYLEGRPVPIAIVGQNGAGKSLLLSTILDAVTEARRASFRTLPEVANLDYLRVSLMTFVRTGANFSHAQITLASGEAETIFDEVVSRTTFENLESLEPELVSLAGLRESEFPTSGFFKRINITNADKHAVSQLSFLYFPFFRYEKPAWMSSKANVEFAKAENFYGVAKLNPVRTNLVSEISRWISDIVLDREIYEKVLRPNPNGAGQIFTGYRGPNAKLISMLNFILESMMKAKDSNVENARLGVSKKVDRGIAINVKMKDSSEQQIVPDIEMLSSGELMCFCMAAEIVRAHELTRHAPPNDLSSVDGIVLIDEIDLHLHIEFQKLILPQIIRMFPNVQFIITTHSPFFLLGLKESGDLDIYNLPIGNRISADEFVEFKKAYEIFVDENQRFRDRFEKVTLETESAGKPLLITEGKTDWQHLKIAQSYLQRAGEFLNLDFDYLEFGDELDMGDIKLSQMCEHVSLLPRNRKVIFVFDRDNDKIIERMSGGDNSFRFLKNDVYSFCIPIPPHRKGYKKISIEHYYADVDLRKPDPKTGKRIWFSNEVIAERNLTTNKNVYRALPNFLAEDELQKVIFDQPASAIVDDNGASVGLSKAAFVRTIVADADLSADFDRSAFRQIFSVIDEICRHRLDASPVEIR